MVSHPVASLCGLTHRGITFYFHAVDSSVTKPTNASDEKEQQKEGEIKDKYLSTREK